MNFVLIHGYFDRFVPVQSSLICIGTLTKCELHILKRCGHWAMIEQREEFLHATKHFLTKGSLKKNVTFIKRQ